MPCSAEQLEPLAAPAADVDHGGGEAGDVGQVHLGQGHDVLAVAAEAPLEVAVQVVARAVELADQRGERLDGRCARHGLLDGLQGELLAGAQGPQVGPHVGGVGGGAVLVRGRVPLQRADLLLERVDALRGLVERLAQVAEELVVGGLPVGGAPEPVGQGVDGAHEVVVDLVLLAHDGRGGALGEGPAPATRRGGVGLADGTDGVEVEADGLVGGVGRPGGHGFGWRPVGHGCGSPVKDPMRTARLGHGRRPDAGRSTRNGGPGGPPSQTLGADGGRRTEGQRAGKGIPVLASPVDGWGNPDRRDGVTSVPGLVARRLRRRG